MSIYDEIGGREAVAATVEVFYERVLGDPVLAPWFRSTDMRRQQAHMRAFIAAALSGPDVYAGRDMGAAHAGLGITDEAFDRVVDHLVATLTELRVAEDTIAAIGSALAPLRAQVVQARAAA